MKRTLIKNVFIALMIGSVALPAAAAVSFGVKGVYLMPSEQVFKDIYGSGLMYGGEIGFRLSGSIGLWLDGMYYKGTGKLTYTEEETTLTLFPIVGAGLRYDFTKGPAVVYAGAGARSYSYKEENVIGTASKSGVGFVGFAGASYRIAKGFLIDVRAAYSSCKLTPADFTVNVGGFELGGGLVFEF
jgi:hypothetical protein